jgi:uncharacterized protein with NRDE domain
MPYLQGKSITVLFRVNPRFPLIVAANREEARRRPTREPFRWPEEPGIWAGQDAVAGGTWLGVNAAGLLAAVTNRPEPDFDAARRSRGLLCLDCLRHESPATARSFVADELTRRRYNAFNLLCANPGEGWGTSGSGHVQTLAPGVHVLSNFGDLDDDRLPVVAEVRDRVKALPLDSPDIAALFAGLGRVCAATDGAVPLCRAGGDYGTVSSSMIAIGNDGGIAAYWHAPGPPCEHAFAPVTISANE